MSDIYEDNCVQIVQDDDTLTGDNNSQINTGLLIIGCFLPLGTFLQSLKEFLNLDSKISKFDNNIKTNRILILDIEEQLYLERSARECPNKLIKRIKETKKNLVTNTPVIPNFIKKRLKIAIERNEVLDIMSKSILYSYLKNQTIDIDGTMFNQNDANYANDANNTNNFDTSIQHTQSTQPNFKDYNSIDDNQVDSPSISEDSHIVIESNLDTISNLDPNNNNNNNQNNNNQNNNSNIYDSNKSIKDKILTNLHSL